MATETKKHGKFLVFVFVLWFVNIFITLITLNPEVFQDGFAAFPTWSKIWDEYSTATYIPILIGVWMWKKAAVYALFALHIVKLVVDLAIFPSSIEVMIGMVIVFLVLLLLTFFGVQRKWRLFG